MKQKIRALCALACLVATPALAREMNISQFVFHDTNRNGIFDLGERPFAGAAVFARFEGEVADVKNSNLSGFTNFAMSDDEPDKDITRPGDWSFSVQPPKGFIISTGNPVQQTEIRPMSQAPGGFIADPPLPFVGLAPELTIEAGTDHADRLTCTRGDTQIEAAIDPDFGLFSCHVTSGTWNVAWHRNGTQVAQRTISVTEWPVRLPFPTGPIAQVRDRTTVVGFDDIIRSENIQEVAAGNGGIHWHNMVATHRKFYGGAGYVNSTVSGEFAAYNSSGHPARLYDDQPFDFIGAYVGVAWPTARKAPVRIQALRDGVVIAEDAFFASNFRPVWFDAGFSQINEIRITHDIYWQVIVDDVTLTPPEK